MTRRWPLFLWPLLALASPVGAQAPLLLVNGETRVASVDFEFPDGQSLPVSQLRSQIALSGPSLGQRVRGVLDILPFVSSPRYDPFSPPELLRDLVRLERYYVEAGFQGSQVEYEASLDTVPNAVDVVFVVREGQPILLDGVEVVDEAGRPLEEQLPQELQDVWPRLMEGLLVSRGERLGSSLRIQIQDRAGNWLRDHGYPFPDVTAESVEESGRARLILTVRSDLRMRVGAMDV